MLARPKCISKSMGVCSSGQLISCLRVLYSDDDSQSSSSKVLTSLTDHLWVVSSPLEACQSL